MGLAAIFLFRLNSRNESNEDMLGLCAFDKRKPALAEVVGSDSSKPT